jgi:hypothetical protein
MSLKSFLDFWSNPPKNASIDPIGKVYHAYVGADEVLHGLKSQGRIYIIPGKNSRGQWIPVFDSDKTDDIAALSGSIDKASTKLKAISNDIEEIYSLAGGPSQINLQTELDTLRNSIRRLEGAAKTRTARALAASPGKRPSEIEALPAVNIAYSQVDAARLDNQPQIDGIEAKLTRIREIHEKYR